MAERVYLNNDWKFAQNFSVNMLDENFDDSQMRAVRIPHTSKETAYHYFDESEYQMISGYRKVLYVPAGWDRKKVFLTFEGIGHESEVYVNGILAGMHRCGYTGFTMDITRFLNFGADNVLAVKVNSKEDLNVPPFGFVIDYMTYGGIYRDVYLELKEELHLEDVFAWTNPDVEHVTWIDDYGYQAASADVSSKIRLNAVASDMKIRQWLKYHDEVDYMYLGDCDCTNAEMTMTFNVECAGLWDTTNPNLYDIRTELLVNDQVVDEKVVTFGFRKAEFRADGFYLNNKKFKIRGLNRHQSYPYVGYAMPQSMQEMDAEILKEELGLNAVRTSHYPQSHYFVNRCDELGLLVFMEIPGWQYIGNESWQDQAVENVKDMVLQYRNHTAIILWGVRINESRDNDAFYTRTNAVCRELDPSRQTAGVRNGKKGHLLEDVFTYNDFVHSGGNRGCEPKKRITSNRKKPYMVTEYNGHMYPTKAFDSEEHRLEHALRHARVLNDIAKEQDICGSFGWCMADYNTHKDFGSGDRICYHGVLDMFRNKKMAADIYASQQEEVPVLSISSTMDLGEHPGSNWGNAFIFTNADSVRMYKNGTFVREYKKEETTYDCLAHGPIPILDFIGELIEKNENMKPKQAKDVKNALNAVAQYGVFDLPKSIYPTVAKLFTVYRMSFDQLMALYSKYIGNWGDSCTEYRFEAIKNGKVVKTVVKKPMKRVRLEVIASHQELMELHSYDVAAIRIRALDDCGNQLPYYQEPVRLQLEGPGELIGPDVISLKGGMGGTYVKTRGEKGLIRLTLQTEQAMPVTVELQVTEVHNQ